MLIYTPRVATSGVCFTTEQMAGDKGFFLLSGLSNKPACYICGKIISNLQNLYKHIRTIHQRQVSRCDHCGSVFCNAESARKHVLKMHRKGLAQGFGLSMLEPKESSGSIYTVCSTDSPSTTSSTTTTTTTPPTITTTTTDIENLQLYSIKIEDLT